MVNRSDVDKRKTPLSVKTVNATIVPLTQPANKKCVADFKYRNFFNRNKFKASEGFNRRFGKIIWKKNTCASEGRLCKLQKD